MATNVTYKIFFNDWKRIEHQNNKTNFIYIIQKVIFALTLSRYAVMIMGFLTLTYI